MTAIERTAYPTFQSHPSHQNELDNFYTPTQDEIRFICSKLNYIRRKGVPHLLKQHYLNMMVLLKCFQRFGYFPTLRTIPKIIAIHIRQYLKIEDSILSGTSILKYFIDIKP